MKFLSSTAGGYCMALAATLFWAGNHTVARALSGTIPPVTTAFWRWVVALVFFLPFGIGKVISEWNLVRKNLLFLSIEAVLGITIFNTLIYVSARSTSAFNISLISMTFPVWILILSRIFLKERMGPRQGLGTGIVFTGILILITRGDLSLLLSITYSAGDLIMVLAAVVFAVYSLLAVKKPEGMSFRTFQLSTFFIGFIFLVPIYLWESIAGPPVAYTRNAVLSLLYIGVFSSLLAYLLWNLAIQTIGAAKAGMMYYTLPVSSGILAFIFLGESVTPVHLVSIVLILLGIILAGRRPKNPTLSQE